MARSIFPSVETKVKTEPIESIVNKIKNGYNKHPVGWTVLSDLKGNILVLGPNEGYMLRMISLNPQEQTGVGIEIDGLHETRKLLRGAPSYGFRPLSNRKAEEILNSFSYTERRNKLISEILERKPVSSSEIENNKLKGVLSGPIIAHPDISTISERQKELEFKLKIEAEKIFRKKYPYRASIYG
jgi:hypothetical protein